MTRKILALTFLALAGLLVAPAHASGPLTPSDDYGFNIPKDKGANPDINRVWSKAKTAAWSKNSTCQLMSSKEGFIAAMSAAGQTGDHVVFFDASAVGSLSAASPDTTKEIAEPSVDTTKEPSVKEFRTGIPFHSGLVMCPSSATSEGAVQFFEQK